MDLKQYEKGAAEAKTTPPEAMTAGYPTNGDPATGQQATSPGAYWYYQIQAELDHLFKQAGLTPDHKRLTQLYEGMQKISEAGGTKTGSLIIWPGNTPPAGCLECNGAALSRTTYASLYSVIGTTYGKGPGATANTTFRLPDARGEFIRGWDHGRGIDPDRAKRTNRGDGTTGDNVGTKQAASMKSHRHLAGLGTNNSSRFHDYRSFHSGLGFGVTGTSRIIVSSTYGTGASAVTSAAGGLENRPRNIAMMIAIKY